MPSPARFPTGAARSRNERRDAAASAQDGDLQSLLGATLERLVSDTGARRAAAWCNAPGEAPRVVASVGLAPPVRSPSVTEYASLAALTTATDLRGGAAPDPARASILREGYTAAVPVGVASELAAAVILLDVARVQPRTLAALDATAERIEGPLLAALAGARLARMDADVRHLDRLAALGGLVAEIVHEVRNPLVSVKTFLQLLPERRDDAEFLRSFLEVAGEELVRIERLLDLVLDHASPRPVTPKPEGGCDVAGVVAAVLRLVGHRAAMAGVTLAAEIPEVLPRCALSADALEQVLLNLSLNALDATPSGGDVYIAARSLGRTLEIDVEDRGPGVPRSLRRRVFEPFFSTKPGRPGGLGLAISLRIVGEADGTLVITDRPAGGSRFRIRVPV